MMAKKAKINVLDGGRIALAVRAINALLRLLTVEEARHVACKVLPRHWGEP